MLEPVISRLFFRPSHEYIASRKDELRVDAPWGQIQIWRERNVPASQHVRRPDSCLYIMRFLGSRGRAEMATLDPADRIGEAPAEVWTVNPPGFGASTGPVSLNHYADSALLAYERMLSVAGGAPCWVTGKSLGTTAALLVSSRLGAQGIVLRNVTPLRELLTGHYGWWNGWIGSSIVSTQIPPALDCFVNARSSSAHALFLASTEDRISPPPFQRAVADAYAGPKEWLPVDGPHDRRHLFDHDEVRYRAALARIPGI